MNVQAHNWARLCLSHGRGRRFNPYSAHHFMGTSRQYPAAQSGTIRKRSALIRGKSGEFVRGTFSRNSCAFLGATLKEIAPRLRNTCRAALGLIATAQGQARPEAQAKRLRDSQVNN